MPTLQFGQVHHAFLQDEAAIGTAVAGADDREGALGSSVEVEPLQRLDGDGSTLGLIDHGRMARQTQELFDRLNIEVLATTELPSATMAMVLG